MDKRDFYDVLGVDRDANEDAIKSAYRKLALKFHPDRNPGDSGAEDKFKEATEAYEILKDPQKRQAYDRFGHAGVSQGAGFGGGFGAGGFDISDALRAFMRDFGGSSFFEDFFGMGMGGQRRRRNRGEDLRVRIKLTLEEIASGVEKAVKIKRLTECEDCNGSGVAVGSSKKTCPQCKGAGQVRTLSRTFLGTIQQVTTCNMCRGSGEIIADPCHTCRGEGRVRTTTTVNVKVPAGVSSGNYMTMESMGNAAPNKGEPGDLIVVFEEKNHDIFIRHGNDIICEMPISFATAAVGGTVSVPTLTGSESVKIPAGTQPGKVFKLRSRGIPNLHRNGKGDLLIRVFIWVPTEISPQDREILEQLAQSDSFKPPKTSKSFFDKLRETLGV